MISNQINRNFIRINILLSKNRPNQSEEQSMQNEVRNLEFLIFFSKSAPGKIFYMMVLGLYTMTNAEMQKPYSYVILVSKLM